MDKKRILVTGASGFIGNAVVRQLEASGCTVVAACRSARPEEPGTGNVIWRCVDLFDEGQTDRLISETQPDALIHLAWSVDTAAYWHSQDNLRWLSASNALIQSCILHGCKRIVTAGTGAEYRPANHPLREDEDALSNDTLYAAAKRSLFQLSSALCRRAGCSYSHGRVFYLYGPNEKKERVFPYVICSLLRGEPARVSHGNQIRDYLHVDDVAAAFVALTASSITGAVNISSGKGVRLKDCFYLMQEATGAPDGLLRFGEAVTESNEPPMIVGDNRILTGEIGWQPQYSLESGMRQTVEWWAHKLSGESLC